MMAEEIKSAIRQFLAQPLRNYELQDDQDIFALGIVNSLFAMQLVLFIEKSFAIIVENEDLELDNFRTIDALASLVMRKKGALVPA
jgi:methoxymalonate biosynthesis acyl carrier protein